MSVDNQEQNGAVVLYEHHTARNRAVFNRMAFTADAEIRASEKAERDELEAKKLAEKAADAKRTMGKYAASLEALSVLYHRLEGSDDLSAAEKATTEALICEHRVAMAKGLREFCGEAVDADKVVANDSAALREKIAKEYGSGRGRHARTQSRDENGQFASGFSPEED